METIIAYVKEHWAVILAVVGYVVTAVVSTMPSPDTDKISYYHWFYDATHMMLNSKLQKAVVVEQTRSVSPGSATVHTTITNPEVKA